MSFKLNAFWISLLLCYYNKVIAPCTLVAKFSPFLLQLVPRYLLDKNTTVKEFLINCALNKVKMVSKILLWLCTHQVIFIYEQTNLRSPSLVSPPYRGERFWVCQGLWELRAIPPVAWPGPLLLDCSKGRHQTKRETKNWCRKQRLEASRNIMGTRLEHGMHQGATEQCIQLYFTVLQYLGRAPDVSTPVVK